MIIALKSITKTEFFLYFPTTVLKSSSNPNLCSVCEGGYYLRGYIVLNTFLKVKRAQSIMNVLLAVLFWYLKVLKRRAVFLDVKIAITEIE